MVFDGIIYGKTIRIRNIEEKDALSSLQMRKNESVNKYLHKVDNTVEEQIEYIKKMREAEGTYLFIAEDFNGTPIGTRKIYNVSANGDTCETGALIGLGSAVQNTELALLGYDFAFQILGVRKILLNVIADNVNVLNSQMRYGAVELYRAYNEEMGTDSVYSELSLENYLEHRASIYKLIERLGR